MTLTMIPLLPAEDDHGLTGACSTVEPDVMFPDESLPNDHPDVHEAKRVCRRCPIAAACLETALNRHEPWGVWGGLTAKERHAMQRKHRRHTAVQPETLLEVV